MNEQPKVESAEEVNADGDGFLYAVLVQSSNGTWWSNHLNDASYDAALEVARGMKARIIRVPR